jgi:hypothetical protein
VLQALQAYNSILAAANTGKVITRDNFDPQVKFFTGLVEDVWGFAGNNTVYICYNEFQRQANRFAQTYAVEPAITKARVTIQLASTSIHEAAHVVLRTSVDNFNMSSPRLHSLKAAFHKDAPEVGNIVEELVFKCVANWISEDDYTFGDLQQVIQALNSGVNIPTFAEKALNVLSPEDVESMFGFHSHGRKKHYRF